MQALPMKEDGPVDLCSLAYLVGRPGFMPFGKLLRSDMTNIGYVNAGKRRWGLESLTPLDQITGAF
jgi:hypothetical protein